MSQYPPIALNALNALEEILTNYHKEGKTYLEEAPYSLDIKAQLTNVLTLMRTMVQPKTPEATEVVGNINVAQEMDDLYLNLRNFKINEEGLAPTEKVAVLRVQTNLLEKIIEMRERAIGIDRYGAFREAIMEFISNKFDPDDINELKEILATLDH